MNPKASLKFLKVKVRTIASRSGTSAQPGSPFRADVRASADSRSTMLVSLFAPPILPPNGRGTRSHQQQLSTGTAGLPQILQRVSGQLPARETNAGSLLRPQPFAAADHC